MFNIVFFPLVLQPKCERTSAQQANKHLCNQTVPASDVDNSIHVATVSSTSVEQLQLLTINLLCLHLKACSMFTLGNKTALVN